MGGLRSIQAVLADSPAPSGDALIDRRLLLWIVLLSGLCLRLPALYLDVAGDHDYRQSVVMAQVQGFAGDPVLEPLETYDGGRQMFDVPIFQLIGAALAGIPGLEPVVAARIVSMLCFCASYLAIALLLPIWGFSFRVVLLTEILYALSPISTHFSMSPLPDNLCIALGLFSVYLLHHYRAEGAASSLVAGVLLGVLATLIKSPIYGFLFGGFVLHWLIFEEERQRTALLHLGLASIFLAAAAGAELLRAAVMGDAGGGGFANPAWYFGPFEDRLVPAHWWRIAKRWLIEYGNPVTAVFSLVGLWSVLRKRSGPESYLLAYWLSAGLLVLVFFNVHQHHNYYQLPFVFLYCLTAALGIEEVARVFASKEAPASGSASGPSRGFVYALAVFFVLSGLVALFHPMRGLAVVRPAYAVLISHHVPTDGFVYFADYDNSPAPLYLSGRRGAKVMWAEKLCEVLESGDESEAYLFLVPEVRPGDACPDERGWEQAAGGRWVREVEVEGIGTLLRRAQRGGSEE